MSKRRLLNLWLLAVLVAIGSGFASSWQFDRHEIRSKASREISEIAAQPAINLNSPVSEIPEFSRIVMTGNFTGDTFLIRNRPLDGRNGFWLVSQFRTIQGYKYPTLIGWFAATEAASVEINAPSISKSQIQISGMARKLESTQIAGDLPKGQYLSVDKNLFNTDSSFFVQALGANEIISSELKFVPIPNTSQGPHLFYAWQWLIFGAIALIGAAWFTKQEKLDVESKRS
jgi:cytochrome oxidase assembly protein ShyY1